MIMLAPWVSLYPLVWVLRFSHTHTLQTSTQCTQWWATCTCKHSRTYNLVTHTQRFSHMAEMWGPGPQLPENINTHHLNYQTPRMHIHKHSHISHTHTLTQTHTFLTLYINTQTRPHTETYKLTQWHIGLIPRYFLQATPTETNSLKETMWERKHLNLILIPSNTHTHTHTPARFLYENYKNFAEAMVIFVHYCTHMSFLGFE